MNYFAGIGEYAGLNDGVADELEKIWQETSWSIHGAVREFVWRS
jgi:hypothetical protein